MVVHIYGSGDFEYSHEMGQFNELVKEIKTKYETSKEAIYVLYNFHIGNTQIDVALLTKNGPALIELKAYEGKIMGIENGSWIVQSLNGTEQIRITNVFEQLWHQKFALINKLIKMQKKGRISNHVIEKDLHNVKCLGYFKKGSTYNATMPTETQKWFSIVTVDSVLAEINRINAGYFLHESEMDEIVRELNLEEYDWEFYSGEFILKILSCKFEQPVEKKAKKPIKQLTQEKLDLLVEKIRNGLSGKEKFTVCREYINEDIHASIKREHDIFDHVVANLEFAGFHSDNKTITVLVRMLDFQTEPDDPNDAYEIIDGEIRKRITEIAPEIVSKLRIECVDQEGNYLFDSDEEEELC